MTPATSSIADSSTEFLHKDTHMAGKHNDEKPYTVKPKGIEGNMTPEEIADLHEEKSFHWRKLDFKPESDQPPIQRRASTCSISYDDIDKDFEEAIKNGEV